MTKNESTKWGFWDITDEQAEKINNGDVNEYNAFFMRNYTTIERLCYDKLIHLSKVYHSEKEVNEIINAFYYDLRFARFESGALISHLLYLSARSVDRSSYQIARKLSPNTLYDSFNNALYFQSIEYENGGDHGEDFHVADLYETAPSPQEGIEEEHRQNHFVKLVESITPLLRKNTTQYLSFYLNGIKPVHADQRLKSSCQRGSKVYKQIEIDLIKNYPTVLEVLQDNGYCIPAYLLHETPPRYDEIMRPIREREAKKAERERKQIEAQAEKERKAQDRAERAETAKERLRAYNREYKRRQRLQAKLATTAETAQTSANF